MKKHFSFKFNSEEGCKVSWTIEGETFEEWKDCKRAVEEAIQEAVKLQAELNDLLSEKGITK